MVVWRAETCSQTALHGSDWQAGGLSVPPQQWQTAGCWSSDSRHERTVSRDRQSQVSRTQWVTRSRSQQPAGCQQPMSCLHPANRARAANGGGCRVRRGPWGSSTAGVTLLGTRGSSRARARAWNSYESPLQAGLKLLAAGSGSCDRWQLMPTKALELLVAGSGAHANHGMDFRKRRRAKCKAARTGKVASAPNWHRVEEVL